MYSSHCQSQWPDLKCFQHCDRYTNIVCFVVPAICPICQNDMITTPMRIPPYILTSPFVSSFKAPCSLVLKPTTGDFIRNYSSTADLHIGVTDSKGQCYDFDEEGLHVGETWQQCISVPVVTPTQITSWDKSLTVFADPRRWTRQRYHEAQCNCFDFVLQFLYYIGVLDMFGPESVLDKKVFCDKILVEKTLKASQYIKHYQRVVREGHILLEVAQ